MVRQIELSNSLPCEKGFTVQDFGGSFQIFFDAHGPKIFFLATILVMPLVHYVWPMENWALVKKPKVVDDWYPRHSWFLGALQMVATTAAVLPSIENVNPAREFRAAEGKVLSRKFTFLSGLSLRGLMDVDGEFQIVPSQIW